MNLCLVKFLQCFLSIIISNLNLIIKFGKLFTLWRCLNCDIISYWINILHDSRYVIDVLLSLMDLWFIQISLCQDFQILFGNLDLLLFFIIVYSVYHKIILIRQFWCCHHAIFWYYWPLWILYLFFFNFLSDSLQFKCQLFLIILECSKLFAFFLLEALSDIYISKFFDFLAACF